MADAQQRGDIGVAPGLGQHALARVDQDDGEIGVGGAGRHVAGILFMARRVGDDEFALVGGEEAVGDIDGDALLPLGLQPVHQQREVDILAGGAEFPGILFQRGQRVLEQQLGVVEQPPDQGGFAVIDAAAGEKAQQRFLFLRGEKLSVQSRSGAFIRSSPPSSSSPSRPFRRCRSAGPGARRCGR